MWFVFSVILLVSCAAPVDSTTSIADDDLHNADAVPPANGEAEPAPLHEQTCSTSEDDDENEVFRTQVLPELQTACAACHASKHTPFFASDDHTQARQAILSGSKVDFRDVAQSRLVLRLTADRHNCPAGDCAGHGQRFIKVLQNWRCAMTETADDLASSAVDILTGNIEIDLSDQLADFAGEISIRATIEPLPAGGEGFTLQDLYLSTTADVFIQQIKPLLNDRWNSLNNTFLQVSCVVTPPGGRLQGPAATTLVSDSQRASLAFAFGELRLANDDDPHCDYPDI